MNKKIKGGNKMIIVTTNEIPGREITETIGLVQGSTVKAKHVGRDIGASLKTLVGGEIRGYSDLMREARDEALQRMIQEAEKAGANAVIGMRYQTSQIMQTASEVIAYGTAVKVE